MNTLADIYQGVIEQTVREAKDRVVAIENDLRILDDNYRSSRQALEWRHQKAVTYLRIMERAAALGPLDEDEPEPVVPDVEEDVPSTDEDADKNDDGTEETHEVHDVSTVDEKPGTTTVKGKRVLKRTS